MTDKDYIDITPKGVELAGQGSKGAKRVVFQETELDIIENNPARLTKEGIQKKLDMYRFKSNNSVAEAMYARMLKTCKKIQKSGTCTKKIPDQEWVDDTGRGRRGPLVWYECQILSYDKKGEPFWVDPIKKLSKKQIEEQKLE